MFIAAARLITDGVVSRRHGCEMPKRDSRIGCSHARYVLLCQRIQSRPAIIDEQAEHRAGKRLCEGPDTVNFVDVWAFPDHISVAYNDQLLDAISPGIALEI